MFQVQFHGRGGQGLVTAAELGELTEAADGHEWAGGGFDAVFVAVGAHIGKRVYMPASASRSIGA